MTLINRSNITPSVTIVIKHDRATVVYGKQPKASLKFQAAGLDIFVKGSSASLHEDCIPNIAMNECLSRHIPLISLRRLK
jgi:hypothetical protein